MTTRKRPAKRKAATKAKKPTLTLNFKGEIAKRGQRMTSGPGWYLMRETKRGLGKRAFKGKLIDTVNMGNVRLAIFSVPK